MLSQQKRQNIISLDLEEGEYLAGPIALHSLHQSAVAEVEVVAGEEEEEEEAMVVVISDRPSDFPPYATIATAVVLKEMINSRYAAF